MGSRKRKMASLCVACRAISRAQCHLHRRAGAAELLCYVPFVIPFVGNSLLESRDVDERRGYETRRDETDLMTNNNLFFFSFLSFSLLLCWRTLSLLLYDLPPAGFDAHICVIWFVPHFVTLPPSSSQLRIVLKFVTINETDTSRRLRAA